MLLLRAESRTCGGLIGCACGGGGGVGCAGPVCVDDCVVGCPFVSPARLPSFPGPILTYTLAPVLSPIPLSLASTSRFTPAPNVSSPDTDGWSGVCFDDAWIDVRIWIAGMRTVVWTCARYLLSVTPSRKENTASKGGLPAAPLMLASLVSLRSSVLRRPRRAGCLRRL